MKRTVVVQGRAVWSMHIHIIWEVLSPWQYARMESEHPPLMSRRVQYSFHRVICMGFPINTVHNTVT